MLKTPPLEGNLWDYSAPDMNRGLEIPKASPESAAADRCLLPVLAYLGSQR
jgi:hypothetical protein